MTYTDRLEIVPVGKRQKKAGINLDGKPLGYAVHIRDNLWTGYADLFDANGSFVRPYTVAARPLAEVAETLAEGADVVRGGGQ